VVPVKQGGQPFYLSLDRMRWTQERPLVGRGSTKAGGYCNEPLPRWHGNGLTILIGEAWQNGSICHQSTGHQPYAALIIGANLLAGGKACERTTQRRTGDAWLIVENLGRRKRVANFSLSFCIYTERTFYSKREPGYMSELFRFYSCICAGHKGGRCTAAS